jgi:hypothetical protein
MVTPACLLHYLERPEEREQTRSRHSATSSANASGERTLAILTRPLGVRGSSQSSTDRAGIGRQRRAISRRTWTQRVLRTTPCSRTTQPPLQPRSCLRQSQYPLLVSLGAERRAKLAPFETAAMCLRLTTPSDLKRLFCLTATAHRWRRRRGSLPRKWCSTLHDRDPLAQIVVGLIPSNNERPEAVRHESIDIL